MFVKIVNKSTLKRNKQISFIMIAVLYMFLVVLAAPSLEQDSASTPISPCPGVFQYEPPGSEPDRWYGVVYLSTDSPLHSLWLNIVLDTRADILGNWLGDVSTHDNKNFKIENSSVRINSGSTLRVRFFVQYVNKRPRLLAIRLNGMDICTASSSTQKGRNKSALRNQTSGRPWPVDRNVDITLRLLTSSKTTNPKGLDGKPQCGTVVAKTRNQGGKSVLETQWPWQIALYYYENGSNTYICGGTLVSARHVITAAHCVNRKSTERAVEFYTLSVFLGKRNLWDSHDGVQVRYVQTIIVNPQYNASTYSHNVAILELHQPLKYTDWVKPACLWPKQITDLKNVIGKKGLLLSWRFKDKNQLMDDLTQEDVPVVSQATCNKSYETFSRFTSEYTFCAGNREETSKCASAGSGMVFNIGPTWYLRGLASLTLPGTGRKRCDTTQYVIYTDLAKFLPWISNTVFDF